MVKALFLQTIFESYNTLQTSHQKHYDNDHQKKDDAIILAANKVAVFILIHRIYNACL